MRRRDFGATLAFALAGCSRAPEDTPLREISIALSEHLTVSAMHLAEELGYLAQAGFRMTVVRLSAIQAVPLLAGGKLDVILGGVPSPLINAVLRGMTIRVVAGREYVNPNCGDGYTLYAHRGAFGNGPVEPARLKGKRFSVRSRGITEFILDTFLKAHGMTTDDVERVDLSLNESIAALAGNRIDAMFDPEFSRSPLAVSADIVKVWRFADVHPFHQYSFVVFGDSMLKEGLAPGARFLAAYLKAAAEFQQGRTPQFMRDFASTHNLDVEATVSACRDTFPADGRIDAASLQRTLDWHASKGYATGLLKAESMMDKRFLDEAQRLLRSGDWAAPAAAPK